MQSDKKYIWAIYERWNASQSINMKEMLLSTSKMHPDSMIYVYNYHILTNNQRNIYQGPEIIACILAGCMAQNDLRVWL